ncbi:MAG: recombinase family protein, partial [Acidobacteriia bacterium]|nr:recombinase family protein [Terriglobia bacterium]
MSSYVIYARKSTESEDRQVLSIPAQIEELRALAATRGFHDLTVLEESRSAKQPGRPVFNQLLKDINEGRLTALLCWKLDRLARNPVDGGSLLWAMSCGKLKEIVTPGHTYTGSAEDRFIQNIEYGMATKYIDDLSANVKRGIKARVKNGWCPAKPPPGYLPDRTNPERRIVIKDPVRFPLIQRALGLVRQGTAPTEVWRILNNAWGYRTPLRLRSGGKPISRTSFYDLLSNPFYCGLISFKGELYKGASESMISPEDFTEIQKQLRRNNRPRPSRHEWAFTGLIRCGECGRAVTASFQRNRHGVLYPYYHCTRRQPCRQPYVQSKEVEKQLADWLEGITIPNNTLSLLVEEFNRHASDRQARQESVINSRKLTLESVKRQLQNLTELRLREQIRDEEYTPQRQRLLLEHQRLEEGPESKDPIEPSKAVISLLSQAKEMFLRGDTAQKRAIVQAVGLNPRLLDRKVLILAQKPFSLVGERLYSPGNWRKAHDVRTGVLKSLIAYFSDNSIEIALQAGRIMDLAKR